MQTLWTRVAQVRGSCRCPQCLSSANGISKRATATATRRVPRYLTSSTLWYSGIFAAAATFDAGVKKHRKEQWDRAIADVRHDLEQPTTQKRQREVVLETEDEEVIATEVKFKPFDALPNDQDAISNLDPQHAPPRWPTNTGPSLKANHLPPESIYAAEGRKRRLDSIPLGSKKLAEVEVATEVLLWKLLVDLRARGWSEEAAKVVPEPFAENILYDQGELLGRLRSVCAEQESILRADRALTSHRECGNHEDRLCRFSQYDLESANQSVRDLNSSLHHLFKLHTDKEINSPSLIAKLAYNMSICSGPPNLKTFNTLMLGFQAMQEPDLVSRAIQASIYAKMRPNEVTLATRLKHYTQTGQSGKFVRLIERMRGKHGGLALARSDIEITRGGSRRLLRQPSGKVIQLPYATPFVFEHIIAGVVKFAGFRTALEICQNMGQDGWGLCTSGLTPLLQDCAERADWRSGSIVWRQIQALKASSRRKQGSKWVAECIKLKTYAAMLRLCTRCSQRTQFDDIWDTAVRVHPGKTEKLIALVKGETAPESVDTTNPLDESLSHAGGQSGTEIVGAMDHAAVALDDISIRMQTVELDDVPDIGQQEGTCQEKEDPRKERSEDQIPPREARDRGNEAEYQHQLPLRTDVAQHLERSKLNRQPRVLDRSEVLEDQLWGLAAAGPDLAEYELSERPMAMAG